MRKRRTNTKTDYIQMSYHGQVYQFPNSIAEKYRVKAPELEELVDPETIFADLNEKYSKPGALLRGLRARENLTQCQMAQKIKVTQSDISQMENGRRAIGRVIAKRLAKLFDIDYRIFLT